MAIGLKQNGKQREIGRRIRTFMQPFPYGVLTEVARKQHDARGHIL